MRYDTLTYLPSPIRRTVLRLMERMEGNSNGVKVAYRDLHDLLEYVEELINPQTTKDPNAKVS
jgi:hypothetical protein